MFRKHLFYLTSDQLCAYLWQGGRLSACTRFANNQAGVDAFMDYLDSHGRGQGQAPAYLLTDLIEEDFQRVSVPHVGGRSGRQLLQRRLIQQYRETPYRHVEIQGREISGRRDDIALLSALTNPLLVQPWIEALEQLKTPLAGLYSTTLLSAELARKLHLRQEHLLLVTQQSGGLRQSYFLNGQLKFSRLTLAIDRNGAAVNVAAETRKTQQFLSSIRLVGRGTTLNTVLLAPAEQLERMAEQCQDTADTAYQFLSLEAAAAKLGLKTGDAAAPQLADTLLLTLLGDTPPAGAPISHYALGDVRRFYRLWRARLILHVSSGLLAAGGLVWIGLNLWQYHAASSMSARLAVETVQYDKRYRNVMANMPPQIASTANMRAAVTVNRMLATQAPSPLAMMRMLSEVLEQLPQIRLTRLDWRVDLPGAAAGPAADGAPAATPSTLLVGVPEKPPQALRVEAEVMVAQDDYRSVIDSMNQFAQALARRPGLTVEIIEAPLDTRSSAKLSGKAGPQPVENRARFTLNLGWKP